MSGESKTPADMRDALLDVAAAANDALYTSYATPEAAAKAYADSLDGIRKRLAPDTCYTPVCLLPAPPQMDAPKRDWLDMPGGFRLSRFHVAGITVFVGVRKNHGDNGGSIYGVEVIREPNYETATFSIVRNGGLLAEGSLAVGRWIAAEQAAVGMLHGYLARKEKERLHNKRNKRNRKARKAAEAAAPKNGEWKMENGKCGGAK